LWPIAPFFIGEIFLERLGIAASIGLGFLTALMAGCAAAWFATIQGQRLGESPEENAWRGFFYFVPAFGVGLVGGILLPRLTHWGLGRNFLIAAGVIVVLAKAAQFKDNTFGYKPNLMGGEPAVLEAEIAMPLGWTPQDAEPFGVGDCDLDRTNADAGIEWEGAELRPDGHWVIPCWTQLRSIYRRRNLSLTMGREADPAGKYRRTESFYIILPPDPYGEADREWTHWSNQSTHEAYACRYRILPEREFKAELEAREVARRAARWKRWAALPADAPFVEWLEPFGRGELPPGAAEGAQTVANARPADFAAVLRSADREKVRAAVYALALVKTIPEGIGAALTEAGTQVAGYAAATRQQDKAEAEAFEFFERWTQTMDHAPGRDNARYRALLDEIQKAAGPRHSVFPTDLPSRLVWRIEKIQAGL
jgi:hypothetical protein